MVTFTLHSQSEVQTGKAGRFMFRARLAILMAACFVFAAAGPAEAGLRSGVSPQHTITCTGDVNAPSRTTTAVRVSGAVECNGTVDIAYTYLTVQIYENGRWRNYGNPFETNSTSATLIMSDGAGLKGDVVLSGPYPS
jgi:hypothetical protein